MGVLFAGAFWVVFSVDLRLWCSRCYYNLIIYTYYEQFRHLTLSVANRLRGSNCFVFAFKTKESDVFWGTGFIVALLIIIKINAYKLY